MVRQRYKIRRQKVGSKQAQGRTISKQTISGRAKKIITESKARILISKIQLGNGRMQGARLVIQTEED